MIVDARGDTHEGEGADEFRGYDTVPPAKRDARAFAAVERRDGRVSLCCVSGRNESGHDGLVCNMSVLAVC